MRHESPPFGAMRSLSPDSFSALDFKELGVVFPQYHVKLRPPEAQGVTLLGKTETYGMTDRSVATVAQVLSPPPPSANLHLDLLIKAMDFYAYNRKRKQAAGVLVLALADPLGILADERNCYIKRVQTFTGSRARRSLPRRPWAAHVTIGSLPSQQWKDKLLPWLEERLPPTVGLLPIKDSVSDKNTYPH